MRGRIRVVTSLAMLLPVLTAAEAGAQRSPLSLSVRGGFVSPSGSFATPGAVDAEVEGGASFGVRFLYRRSARSKVYLGFSQHRFGCAGTSCTDDGDYVWTGWEMGTRLDLTGSGIQPWIRVGGVFARVERNFARGPAEGEGLSDLSAGLEAGAGLSVPLGGRFRAEAGTRYVWLNAGFPGEGILRMRYFVSDLGLDVRF